MKKYYKEGMGFVTAGVGLSVGSQVLGDVGATHAQTAVGKFTGAMPTMAGLTVAKHVIKKTKMLGGKKFL